MSALPVAMRRLVPGLERMHPIASASGRRKSSSRPRRCCWAVCGHRLAQRTPQRRIEFAPVVRGSGGGVGVEAGRPCLLPGLAACELPTVHRRSGARLRRSRAEREAAVVRRGSRRLPFSAWRMPMACRRAASSVSFRASCTLFALCTQGPGQGQLPGGCTGSSCPAAVPRPSRPAQGPGSGGVPRETWASSAGASGAGAVFGMAAIVRPGHRLRGPTSRERSGLRAGRFSRLWRWGPLR